MSSAYSGLSGPAFSRSGLNFDPSGLNSAAITITFSPPVQMVGLTMGSDSGGGPPHSGNVDFNLPDGTVTASSTQFCCFTGRLFVAIEDVNLISSLTINPFTSTCPPNPNPSVGLQCHLIIDEIWIDAVPPPKIDSISSYLPNAGLAGRPLRILGSGFGTIQGPSTVTIGSLNAGVNSWSNTQLSITVPPLLQPGVYGVIVTTNSGTSNLVTLQVRSLPDAATDLVLSVLGGPYLGDGAIWGGKGWDYLSFNPPSGQEGRWAFPAQLTTGGYYYYDAEPPASIEFGSGVDCSGLVLWAYNRAFGAMNHQERGNPIYYEGADGQYTYDTDDLGDNPELRPGDLIFLTEPNGLRIRHVALFVGPTPTANCDSASVCDVIHASTPKNNPNAIKWTAKADLLANAHSQHRAVLYGRVKPPRVDLQFNAHSPVGLFVLDPDGNNIGPETFEITGEELLREVARSLYYSVPSVDVAGRANDRVTAPVLKAGLYTVRVVPKQGVSPTETYTLDVVALDKTVTLAKDVSISNIPPNGYGIRMAGNEIIAFNPIAIDVKPDDVHNSINPRSRGVISVALLGTSTLNVSSVDWTTVHFGRTGSEASAVQVSIEDVNGDNLPDMVLHFKTEDTGLTCQSAFAFLTAKTIYSQQLGGTDTITVVGCK